MNGSHREPTTSAGPDFRKSLTWLALIAIASTPSIAPPTYAESDASRDWIATLDADPVWQSPTTAGVLVVGTVAGIVGLDGATGKPLWRIGDLKDHDVTLEALLPEPYALLRLKKGVRGNVVRVLIDVTTGREVWDSSTFGMTDVYHERYVPSLDALLVAGKADERKMVVAVDLESGHRLREFAVPEADVGSILNESVLFDTDSTVVTVSGDRLIRYDLQSGAMSWTSPRLDVGTRKDCAFLNAPPGKSGFVVAPNAERNDPRPLLPVAPMLLSSDGRCVFAARGQSLQALDASGLALWRNPPELCGRCVQMLETRAGLLARTMPEIAGNDQLVMLERGTGSILWQYPPFSRHTKLIIIMSAFRSVVLSNPLVDSTAAYVLAGRHLVRIDLATGEASKVGETGIDEKGVHLRLERDGEGFLVVGRQEIEWLDAMGKSVRHVHYRPPGNVGMAAFQLGALAMAVEIAKSAGFRDVGEERTMTIEDVPGHYITMKTSPKPIFRGIGQSFVHKFHASSNLDSLVFMLASLNEAGIKGTALVGIDKRSGQTVHRIPIFSKPNYEIDPFGGWIFVMNARTIRAHAL